MKLQKQLLVFILLISLFLFTFHLSYHLLFEHTADHEHQAHCPFKDFMAGFIPGWIFAIFFTQIILSLIKESSVSSGYKIYLDVLRNRAPPIPA